MEFFDPIMKSVMKELKREQDLANTVTRNDDVKVKILFNNQLNQTRLQLVREQDDGTDDCIIDAPLTLDQVITLRRKLDSIVDLIAKSK
jgi:hypothetical protein